MADGASADFEFIHSPMGGGKTFEAIRLLYDLQQRRIGSVAIKPLVDSKGDANIVSRVGLEWPVDCLIGKDDSVVEKVVPIIVRKSAQIVIADEIQFFQPEQVDDLYWKISCDLGTRVVAFGLRADFRGQPFPGSERALALADSIRELPAMCDCGDEARHNFRLVDGIPVFVGDQVVIDDNSRVEYRSLCKDCYRREFLKSDYDQEPIVPTLSVVEQQ